MRFGRWLLINEASYKGNIGVMEMIKFYRIASESEIKEMERAAEHNDWKAFKTIIKRVLKTEIM